MPNNTIDDDAGERRNALERFAGANDDTRERGTAMIPAQALGPANERIIGAQAVAVYRDERKILQKLEFLASAAGDDWYYRYPVNKRTKDKATGEWVQSVDWIEGPSIKLTNDLARLYGNCDVDVRELDVGDGWIFYARFSDIETGYSLTRPFRQNKGAGKIGGADDSRRLDIAYQIGVSKAYRNVIRNALQTFADFAFEEAKGALVEKIGKNVEGWRARLVEKLTPILDIRRVEKVIGRTRDAWLAADIGRVIAMAKAIEDGMAALDETFPPLSEAEAAKPDQLAKFGGEGKAADPPGDKAGEKEPAAKRTRKRSTKADASESKPPAGQEPAQPGADKPAGETGPNPPTEQSAPAGGDAGAEADSSAGMPTADPKAAKGKPEGPPPNALDLREVIDNASSVAKLREFWKLKVEPWKDHLGATTYDTLSKRGAARQKLLQEQEDAADAARNAANAGGKA